MSTLKAQIARGSRDHPKLVLQMLSVLPEPFSSVSHLRGRAVVLQVE